VSNGRLASLGAALLLAASMAGAQTDLQRAENLATCLRGRYPALCKKAWLSAAELRKTEAAERRENLATCLDGKYPTLCHRQLLTPAERSQVDARTCVPVSWGSTAPCARGSCCQLINSWRFVLPSVARTLRRA
jgi:hypothetical protein